MHCCLLNHFFQMVSETLNLLTVHVIWKTKALPPSTSRSPEEQRLEETLIEQRNSVLEKLLEYAVGTQSNTVEGVRRAVSRHGFSKFTDSCRRCLRPF
jgi:cohesin complex subunit SA-1/2